MEIKTTLKNGIAVHYHQDSELIKRLLYLWELNLFLDVFSESGGRAVYDALFHLLSYIDQLSADNNPSGLPMIMNSSILGTLQKHWNREYIGPSCESLGANNREYEVISKQNKHFSKSLLFIQLSETGKSRLADEYGKPCPMMTFVLRNDDPDFPPSDKMILGVMCDSSSLSAIKIESRYENAQKRRPWLFASMLFPLASFRQHSKLVSILFQRFSFTV